MENDELKPRYILRAPLEAVYHRCLCQLSKLGHRTESDLVRNGDAGTGRHLELGHEVVDDRLGVTIPGVVAGGLGDHGRPHGQGGRAWAHMLGQALLHCSSPHAELGAGLDQTYAAV